MKRPHITIRVSSEKVSRYDFNESFHLWYPPPCPVGVCGGGEGKGGDVVTSH